MGLYVRVGLQMSSPRIVRLAVPLGLIGKLNHNAWGGKRLHSGQYRIIRGYKISKSNDMHLVFLGSSLSTSYDHRFVTKMWES